jgi:tetratricopeptide (TPR) repeat protein
MAASRRGNWFRTGLIVALSFAAGFGMTTAVSSLFSPAGAPVASTSHGAGEAVQRGVALWEKGDIDGAIAEWRQGLAAAPKDPGLLRNLARGLYEKRDFAGAVQAYEQALEGVPDDQNVRTDLAWALLASGRYGPAAALAEDLLRRQPSNGAASTVLVRATAALRQAPPALPPESPPGSLPAVEAALANGMALWRTGNLDGAIAEWRQGLANSPNHPGLLRNLARGLYERRDFTGAVNAYERTLLADPGNAGVEEDLAWALLSAGREKEAARLAERILGRDPQSGAARAVLEKASGRR